MTGTAVRALALAVALGALLGCQTTHYDDYRDAHPEWEAPDAPLEDMNLEEVLAYVHAPDGIQGISVEVTSLEIHEAIGNPWRRIDPQALRRGEERSEDGVTYAVLVQRACTTKGGFDQRGLVRVAYYLLPGNRLSAWDDYSFREGCDLTNRFRAARLPAVPVEVAVSAHLVESYGKPTLSLDQLYRRGLAYVEAGRLLEARAALEVAEPAYRQAVERRGRNPQARAALVEVARLRTSLMRALGVEEKPAAS